MNFREEEFLPLSGLQHFAFCRRQWALIHLEQQWQENLRTIEGQLLHERAHDASLRERRGDTLVLRSLAVASPTLGLSGQCDVVEFRAAPEGVPLAGEEGRWLPFPVEYKRGRPKPHQADELQLCAQAMCLEEMLCCPVPEGALYYGETRRRTPVRFSPELRRQVQSAAEEMHQLFRRGHTPKARPGKFCGACSLKELCLPQLIRRESVSDYDVVRSHPSRGAWIEIVRNTTSPSIPGISRTPHGVRGLKSAAGPRPHGVCLSHPSRVRGLNCLTGAPGQFAGDAA